MTRIHKLVSTVVHSSSTPATQSPDEASVQSDFLFIIAALICSLVCIVGLIAVARCAWLRRRLATNRSPNQPPANKGVKKKIVDSLPKFAFDSANEERGGKLSSGDCVICLVEYADGDEIRVLPQCGHGFHIGCIDKWLGSHSSCPSCRRILVVSRCEKCGEVPKISAGKGSGEGRVVL